MNFLLDAVNKFIGTYYVGPILVASLLSAIISHYKSSNFIKGVEFRNHPFITEILQWAVVFFVSLVIVVILFAMLVFVEWVLNQF